jgi:hypothetical protein
LKRSLIPVIFNVSPGKISAKPMPLLFPVSWRDGFAISNTIRPVLELLFKLMPAMMQFIILWAYCPGNIITGDISVFFK